MREDGISYGIGITGSLRQGGQCDEILRSPQRAKGMGPCFEKTVGLDAHIHSRMSLNDQYAGWLLVWEQIN